MTDPLEQSTEQIETYQTRVKKIFSNPNVAKVIFDHISNGGTPIGLAEIWDIKATDVFEFCTSPTFMAQYKIAMNNRVEWEKERILHEIRKIGTADFRKIFTDTHALKPISEWPEECVAAIAGIEVAEIDDFIDGEKEKIGDLKKVKLTDKLKALELLGKQAGMFAQKVEHGGKVTLEELVTKSIVEEKPV